MSRSNETTQHTNELSKSKRKHDHQSSSGKKEARKSDQQAHSHTHSSNPTATGSYRRAHKNQNKSKKPSDTPTREELEASPPPYQPENVEDMTAEQIQALQESLNPEALEAERLKQMNLLSSLMDATGEISVKPKIKAPELAEEAAENKVKEDATSNSEAAATTSAATEPAKKKARLALLERAKAPTASTSTATWQPPARYVPPTNQQQQQTAATEEEDSSESEAEAEPEPKQQRSQSKPKENAAVKMNSLKEIFKPHEAEAGFSLGDMLGEEDLEEDDYDPFAAFKPAEAQESYSSYQPARYQPQTLGGGPGTKTRPSEAPLFFPLCLDDESDELLNSLNLSAEQKARLEERSWTAGSGRRFNKLGSSEDIAKRHEELRPQLTEQVRKRHREALRKTQRHRG